MYSKYQNEKWQADLMVLMLWVIIAQNYAALSLNVASLDACAILRGLHF